MNNNETFNYCKKVIREHSDMKVFNDEKTSRLRYKNWTFIL